jgi:16S rRNA pseudouridine516 synthase
MRLVKLIANLGYGSRKEVTAMFREGRITDVDGEVLYADDKVEHARVLLDGQPLDPPHGMLLMMHKPTGFTRIVADDR